MNPTNQPGDRRPIATRETTPAKKFSSLLVRLGCSPNGISVTGMFSGIGAGVAFALTAHLPDLQRWFWLLGAGLVQARLLANMFDGMVAVESGKTSAVGELYNEIPDRVSDIATLVGVGLAAHSNLALGLGAATAAVLVAYVRAQGKVAGADQEFCGPMAKPHRMFLVTMLGLFNAAAPLRFQGIRIGNHEISVTVIVLWIIIAGCGLTTVRRIARAARTLNSR